LAERGRRFFALRADRKRAPTGQFLGFSFIEQQSHTAMPESTTKPTMTPRTRGTHALRSRGLAGLLCCLTLSALPLLTGCNILGPAIYFIHGPEKVPKLYALDPKRRTVVFIDDRRNQLPRRSLRQVMAEKAQGTLLDERCLEAMIDAKAALAVTARDKATEPMKITEIAKAVDAEVIIYATVDQFVLSTDGQTFAPAMALRIKVLDAINEKRLWPDDKNGHNLVLNIPIKQGFVPQNQSEVMKAENEAAEAAGLAIAQLFFEHEVQAAPAKSKADGF